jgi:hypothetical protein
LFIVVFFLVTSLPQACGNFTQRRVPEKVGITLLKGHCRLELDDKRGDGMAESYKPRLHTLW